MNLAEFLKDKRELAGLQQKQVATALGYSTAQFLSNWERGISSPPAKAIKILAEKYSVTEKELIGLVHQFKSERVQRTYQSQLVEAGIAPN